MGAWRCRSACISLIFPHSSPRMRAALSHPFPQTEQGPSREPAQPPPGVTRNREGLGVQAKRRVTHTLSTSVSRESAHLGRRAVPEGLPGKLAGQGKGSVETRDGKLRASASQALAVGLRGGSLQAQRVQTPHVVCLLLGLALCLLSMCISFLTALRTCAVRGCEPHSFFK